MKGDKRVRSGVLPRMARWVDRLERLPARHWVLLLALVALGTRLAWAAAMSDRQPRFDEIAYVGHAERLCMGLGYVDEVGRPANFWPPGFPLVLAGAYWTFGRNPMTGVGLQVGLGMLTCVLVSLLGERVFGRSIGRLAALALALYPTSVFYGTLMLTEPLFTLLLLVSCILLLWSLRSGSVGAIAAGAVLGLAILTRPVLVLLPALVPLWYAANGLRLRRAAMLGALVAFGVLAVVSPWLARNHGLFGTWTELSTTGGFNFLIGNDAAALGGCKDAVNVAERLRSGELHDWSRGYRLGWEATRDAPARALLRGGQKVSYFFALETDGVLWNLKGLRSRASLLYTVALLALANVAYVIVVSSCLLGLSNPTGDRAFRTLFVLIGGYLVLMVVVFYGDPRYHFPLVPLALLIAAKALSIDGPELRTNLRQGDPAAHRWFRRWALGNGAFAVLILGNLWLKYLGG